MGISNQKKKKIGSFSTQCFLIALGFFWERRSVIIRMGWLFCFGKAAMHQVLDESEEDAEANAVEC